MNLKGLVVFLFKQLESVKGSIHSQYQNSRRSTSGTASLSACAEVASVVTVLFTIDDDCHACLRRAGAARLVLNARENIVLYAIAARWSSFSR